MSNLLPWIDIETTGLDETHDVILEIALVLTSHDLQTVIPGPNLLIKYDDVDALFVRADRAVMDMHTSSGLIGELRESPATVEVAYAQSILIDFLTMTGCIGKPLCGSSISFDRKFLRKYMPDLDAQFHYRNIDVSTLKELTKVWRPNWNPLHPPTPSRSHRAYADIIDSIEELKTYKDFWLAS